MANIKNGIIGVIATVLIVIIEVILFPIALTFLPNLNSTGTCNSTGGACIHEWISADDKTIIKQLPTLFTVVVLFTVLGGMVGSVYLAVKS